MKCCAVIPVYNHERVIAAVVSALRAEGLPVILVDDGSGPVCAAELNRIAALPGGGINLVRRRVNGGKGAAVLDGLRAAAAQGFSHALQIDADGQHDVADVPAFLALAAASPEAVIVGQPVYDRSVPRGRLYGRYLTHVWVWINTLSLRIADSMCGFRVYPLDALMPLLGKVHIGHRMDFDTEVLVRLDWAGVPIRNQPTRVRYPEDGVSHFRPLADNLAISSMHARLFFGMLLRFPRLLARHLAAPRRRA